MTVQGTSAPATIIYKYKNTSPVLPRFKTLSLIFKQSYTY